MMYSLTRGYKLINLWLDSTPPASFMASSLAKQVMRPKKVITASHRIAAVEASIPCGACTGYALLGGELIESHLDSLEVVVSVNPEGEQFKSFLVPTGDEARIGLEDVYVRGVMAGIEGMNETHGLPSRASLQFRWAAHGEVGSSVLMFAMLSRLVLQLLAVPRDASEEEIRDIALESTRIGQFTATLPPNSPLRYKTDPV